MSTSASPATRRRSRSKQNTTSSSAESSSASSQKKTERKPRRTAKRSKKEAEQHSTSHDTSRSSSHSHDAEMKDAGELVQEEVMEEGKIYFLYRSKIDVPEAQSLEDVQKLHILLAPNNDAKHSRLLIMARKRLPDPDKHERFFAFVAEVGPMQQIEEKHLEPGSYSTATRGERHYQGDRILAEGRYLLGRHHKGKRDHSNLAYVLETPAEPGDAQLAFHIQKEASYILVVKNPRHQHQAGRHGSSHASPQRVGLSASRQAEFPESIQAKFADRAFLPASPELLNYQGAEMIWIGATSDVVAELGVDAGHELEREAKAPEGEAQVRRELHMENAKEHPADAIITGQFPGEDASSSSSSSSHSASSSSA